ASGGLTASDNAVAASINRWSFSTTDFSGTVVDYSADGTSGWATSGSAVAANMRYVRVTSTVSNLPLYFLPVLGALTSSIGVSTTVNARAVAGLVNEPPVLLPFSPIAHDVTINVAGVAGHSDANYGFTVGVQYDLMWPGKP